MRDSGVRLLQTSEIATVYHSLIEENKVEEVEEVEKLDFVEYIYPYKTRIYTANKGKTFEEIATKDKIIGGVSSSVKIHLHQKLCLFLLAISLL